MPDNKDITEDLGTLAYAAQEALGYLREIDDSGYYIPDHIYRKMYQARANLLVLSESLTHLDKKAKGGMS